MVEAVDPNLIKATVVDFSPIAKGFENANDYALKAMQLDQNRETLKAKYAQMDIQKTQLNIGAGKFIAATFDQLKFIQSKEGRKKSLDSLNQMLQAIGYSPIADSLYQDMLVAEPDHVAIQAFQKLKDIGAKNPQAYAEMLAQAPELATNEHWGSAVKQFLDFQFDVAGMEQQAQKIQIAQEGLEQKRIEERRRSVQTPLDKIKDEYSKYKADFDSAVDKLDLKKAANIVNNPTAMNLFVRDLLKATGDTRPSDADIKGLTTSIGGLVQRFKGQIQKAKTGTAIPEVAQAFKDTLFQGHKKFQEGFKKRIGPLVVRAQKEDPQGLSEGRYIGPSTAKELGLKIKFQQGAEGFEEPKAAPQQVQGPSENQQKAINLLDQDGWQRVRKYRNQVDKVKQLLDNYGLDSKEQQIIYDALEEE